MPDWGLFNWNKTWYNEGDRITKSPIESGGSPVWSTDRTGVPVTTRHDPCGYWFKDFTVPVTVTDTEGLVFENGGTVYLAALTAVGYTITQSAVHGITGYIVGAGWDKENSQFIIFEDDFSNVNAHKIAIDGTLVSTYVLMVSPSYSNTMHGYVVPDTDKWYILYTDTVTEGVFPNETDNLYVYFNQFDTTGTLENSWNKKLISIIHSVDLFVNLYYIATVVDYSGVYNVIVPATYWIDGAPGTMYYSFCVCAEADGTFTEYKFDSGGYGNAAGPVVKISDNLYAELYDSGPVTYTGLYTSAITDPTTVSLVGDPLRDFPTYAPWCATALEDLGVYISDQGAVMDVSTGAVLYQITELSDYLCSSISRTLV
jgi:hypothetical protein